MNTIITLKSNKYPGYFYIKGYSSIEKFLSDFPVEIYFPMFGEYIQFYVDEVDLELKHLPLSAS